MCDFVGINRRQALGFITGGSAGLLLRGTAIPTGAVGLSLTTDKDAHAVAPLVFWLIAGGLFTAGMAAARIWNSLSSSSRNAGDFAVLSRGGGNGSGDPFSDPDFIDSQLLGAANAPLAASITDAMQSNVLLRRGRESMDLNRVEAGLLPPAFEEFGESFLPVTPRYTAPNEYVQAKVREAGGPDAQTLYYRMAKSGDGRAGSSRGYLVAVYAQPVRPDKRLSNQNATVHMMSHRPQQT